MAKARVKDEGLKDWGEVDLALLEIGRLDRDVESVEAEAQKLIEAAKQEMVARTQPLLARRKLLALQMEHFCLRHQGEMEGRSRVLNYGVVKLKRAARISYKATVGAVVAALERLGLEHCIRRKAEPDKERLRLVEDEILALAGVRKVEYDSFSFEVDREKVRESG
jgi:phage host-nuclease inhibitor protein Gam